jgi:hypothetical protein
MSNSLNQELLNKRVVLKKDLFGPHFQDEESRTVDVWGGFGAKAESRGTMLMVHFLDGTTSSYRGYDVEKLIGDARVPMRPVIRVGDEVSFEDPSDSEGPVTVFGSIVTAIEGTKLHLDSGEVIEECQVISVDRDRSA